MSGSRPILYAEDDENDVFFMQRAFKQAGVVNPLRTVPDGKHVIDYLEGREPYANRLENPMPCLILLDLSMPGKSGMDVLKWVRSQPFTSALPVIVLTSSNQESDIQRAYVLGANGYLIKPGRPDELQLMVKGVSDYWLSHNRTPVDSVGYSADGKNG